MLYELIRLIDFASQKTGEGKQLTLATIIKTTGSSYRKKGTQMVVAEDQTYEGALSGGCVENEVLRQSMKVFRTKESVIFEYDGRYKLGCKGVIHILIEYFDKSVLHLISNKIAEYQRSRKIFRLGINKDHDMTKACVHFSFGTENCFISRPRPEVYDETEDLEIHPHYQLVIIGGEFDSVILARIADQIGIETFLVVKETFTHALPKTVKVAYLTPEALVNTVKFDEHTAIVLMTHSLSRDLTFLIEMLKVKSKYMGILGPPSRREMILADLFNYNESLFLTWQDKLENLHGPVGLSIGATTPEEISISILSEIISVFNHQRLQAPLV
ncbi:MAG: XdhC family protein [Cyclobacteriaceae bacterium]